MDSAPAIGPSKPEAPSTPLLLLPVGLGLAALYVPTLYDLARSLWQSEDHFHGAIVFVVFLWLVGKERSSLASIGPHRRRRTGWVLFFAGLLLYVLGRSQDILLFEVGSMLWVLAGVCLITLGPQALRALWFPILLLGFMVPLPGIVVDTLTGPLKAWVSTIVTQLLYAVGYPIARTGVVLSIGPYQLLIADACSGLNSMFSLGALGALYVYLVGHVRIWRIALLSAFIVPIAFFANIVRVIFLVLITFHMGDEAGQGFLHGFSGMVLFVSALSFFLMVDWTIDMAIKVGCGPAR